MNLIPIHNVQKSKRPAAKQAAEKINSSGEESLQGLKPNVTYFIATSTVCLINTSAASRDWLLAEKSSVAELPLNLTWNIYAFSGFLRRTSGQALPGAKNAPVRMTVRFRGRTCYSAETVRFRERN
jgi:hypothetical protein